MGILVEMIKIGSINDEHIYMVTGDKQDIYVALSSKNRKISFYRDGELKNLIDSIELEDKKWSISMPCLDGKSLWGILHRSIRAIDANEFPNKMAYCA